MQTLHSIHVANGPFLSIPIPAELRGKKVEVVVTAVEESQGVRETEQERKIREATMEKPKLSPELERQLRENPDLLKGSVLYYKDPFGPACPPEDWEALS